MDFMTIIQSLGPFIGGAATAGAFKGPIKTFEDWWFVNFGADIALEANLLKEKHALATEEFRNDTLKETLKIHPENVQQPKLSILGPTLEASRYYIEEEELRNMFAKLIASSMDKSKNNSIHNSYVEIIKQMNSLDAKNLHAIASKKAPYENIICNLLIRWPNNGSSTEYSNLYFGNEHEKSQTLISQSLVNLNRLGLINLDYTQWANNDDAYSIFEICDEFKEVQNIINYNNSKLKLEHPNNSIVFTGPEIRKGVIIITDFGKAFIKVAIS